MKKEKMNSLSILEAQRKALRLTLKNFEAQPPDGSPPAAVKVMEGSRELVFKFEDGKCVETPPSWNWALRWQWNELRQYFQVHAYKVVLQEERATA